MSAWMQVLELEYKELSVICVSICLSLSLSLCVCVCVSSPLLSRFSSLSSCVACLFVLVARCLDWHNFGMAGGTSVPIIATTPAVLAASDPDYGYLFPLISLSVSLCLSVS